MRTITKIEDAIGVSVRDVDNWIARLNLQTEYLPSRRGKARRYTFENALELGLIAAMVRLGMQPHRSVAFASVITGTKKFDRSLVFRDGKPDIAEVLEWDSPFEHRQSATVAIINPWWVRNHLLDYFDQHAEGSDDEEAT